MTKLSDTQTIILAAAAQRDDGNVLPLPGSLRGGAVTKVVGALLSRGLIAERATDSMAKAETALNRIWRNEPDGSGVLLFITPAGLDAIGIETTTTNSEAPVEYRLNKGTTSAGEPAAGARPRGPTRRRSSRRRRSRAAARRPRTRARTRPLSARAATGRNRRS